MLTGKGRDAVSMERTELALSKRTSLIAADRPRVLLIRPSDEAELASLESTAALIAERTAVPFALASFAVNDWNDELSPWEAPPVFGKRSFGQGAGSTLHFVENELLPSCFRRLGMDAGVPAVIGGYSLAALFALYAVYHSAGFAAAAAASPSVWFPNWVEHAAELRPNARFIYLSLGDAEAKTKNALMRTVADRIEAQRALIESSGAACVLEWNTGGHFNEPELRTARAFAACVNALSNEIE